MIENAVILTKSRTINKCIDLGTDMIDTVDKAQKQKEFLASILK